MSYPRALASAGPLSFSSRLRRLAILRTRTAFPDHRARIVLALLVALATALTASQPVHANECVGGGPDVDELSPGGICWDPSWTPGGGTGSAQSKPRPGPRPVYEDGEPAPGHASGETHAGNVFVPQVPSAIDPTGVHDAATDHGRGVGLGYTYYELDVASFPDTEYERYVSEAPPPTPSIDCSAGGPGCEVIVPNRQGGVEPANAHDHVAEYHGSDPVNPANGELVVSEVDLSLPGFGVPFSHVRTYRSRVDFNGPLGYGWDHSYNQRLTHVTGPACTGAMLLSTGRATAIRFEQALATPSEITYTSPPGVYASLRRVTNGNDVSWTLTENTGLVSVFDHRGLLVRMRDQVGNQLQFSWEPGARTGEDWRLATVVDTVGRTVRYQYDAAGYLSSVGVLSTEHRAQYTVDSRGDLVFVRDALAATSTYTYDTGWPFDVTYVPEAQLRAGCELACAPSTSSCDAGGACDDARADGVPRCHAACGSCLADCSTACVDACHADDVRAQCLAGGEDWTGCVETCDVACNDPAKFDPDAACEQIWDMVIKKDEFGVDQTLAQYCELQCDIECDVTCALAYERPEECNDPDATSEVLAACDAAEEEWQFNCVQCCALGNTCDPASCQDGMTCLSTCRRAFFGDATCSVSPANGGCPTTIVEECRTTCEGACVGDCQLGCVDNCGAGCLEGCDYDGCIEQCEDIDYGSLCEQGCVEGCIEENRAWDGPRYGFPRDLNHNLIAAFDATGVRYLHNEYETDVHSPAFDRVVVHTVADDVMYYDYRDLFGELRGYIAEPTSGLAAEHAEGLSTYQPVEICAEPCAVAPQPVDELELAPWRDTLIALVSAPSRIGGFQILPLNNPVDLAPTIFAVNGSGTIVRASPITPGAVVPQSLRFTVMIGREQVSATVLSTGQIEFRGTTTALAQLSQHATITLFTGAGGALRMYPQRPHGFLHVAEGQCTMPFKAAATTDTSVVLSPATACSGPLIIAPMATAVDANEVPSADAAASSNLFSVTTSLAPGRYAIRWDAENGQWESRLAANGGAAPGSLGSSLAGALAVAPLLRAPASSLHPKYIAHLPGTQRPTLQDGGVLPSFDMVAEFDPQMGAEGGCPRPADQPVWGAGARPAWATVILDMHGTPWTYYYDDSLQTLRSVSHGSEATRERSWSYDRAGNIVGALDPLGGFTCARYSAAGVPTEITTFPGASALGGAAPIRQTFSYEAFPVRMKSASDPNDPARALMSYGWNGDGVLVSVANALGEVTTVVPNARGVPERVVTPDGAATELGWDDGVGVVASVVLDADGVAPMVSTTISDTFGRPTYATSATGEVTTWAWNGPFLESMTYDAGEVHQQTHYGYDANGRVTSVSDGLTSTTLSYDGFGQIRRQHVVALDGTAAPATSCFHHSADGRALEVVHPEGSRERYFYDTEGRLAEVRAGALSPQPEAWDDDCPAFPTNRSSAIATTRRVEYDLNGRPAAVTNASGARTTVQYDGFGRAALITNPRGTHFTIGYDPRGNVVWRAAYSRTLPFTTVPYRAPLASDTGLLAASEYAYDALGRTLVSDQWHFMPSGTPIGDGRARTSYAYDGPGRTTTIVDDAGAATVHVVDALGRPLHTTLPTEDVIAWSYSPDGLRITKSWPAPTGDGFISETTQLTSWGAVAHVESAETGLVQILAKNGFDGRGRTTSVTSATGLVSNMSYDAFGRVLRTDVAYAPSSTATTVFAWARDGLLDSRTSSGAGMVTASTSYTYDALGRVAERTRPQRVPETWIYSGGASQPTNYTDPRGVAYEYQYLPTGQVTFMRAVRGSEEGRRYYDYDELGRMSHAVAMPRTTLAMPIHTMFEHDSLGNRTGEHNNLLGTAVTHSYDGLGRLRSSSLPGGRTVTRDVDELGRLTQLWLDGTLEVELAYDGLGGPTSRTVGSGVNTHYVYDDYGRLVGLSDASVGNPLAQWRWPTPVDGVPRAAALSTYGGPERGSAFSVDRAGRLLRENRGVTGLEALSLSAGQSWNSAEATVSPMLGGFYSRTYDLDGRANWRGRSGSEPGMSVTPTLTASDAYSSFGTSAALYDADGALRHFAGERYDWDLFGGLVHYEGGLEAFDFERDALGRVVVEHDLRRGTTTQVGYDGLRRALFRDAATGETDVVVDGDALDEHLLIAKADGSRYYLHQDRQGSVYLASDAAGDAVEWYSYTAYGEMTIADPSGGVLGSSLIGNRFGFQGQMFHPALPVVDMRARMYRPGWGRFISPDPIGLAGGANLYAFVGSAPLAFIDPLGLRPPRTSAVCRDTYCHPHATAPRVARGSWQPVGPNYDVGGSGGLTAFEEQLGDGVLPYDVARIAERDPEAFERFGGLRVAYVDQDGRRHATAYTFYLPEYGYKVYDRWGAPVGGGTEPGVDPSLIQPGDVLVGLAGPRLLGSVGRFGPRKWGASLGAFGDDAGKVAAGVTNPIPSRMARVIPAEFANGTRLAAPGANEAWVTAADDLAGIATSEGLAQRLTLVDGSGSLIPGPRAVIEFDAVFEGLASPVFRDAPGFIGGGLTAGGAREFVIPNLVLDSLKNVTVRIIP